MNSCAVHIGRSQKGGERLRLFALVCRGGGGSLAFFCLPRGGVTCFLGDLIFFFETINTLIRDQAFLGLDIGKGHSSRNEITSPYAGGARLDMCTRES